MGEKIINFGYNDYDELKDVIQNGDFYKGIYLDMININNRDYLVTKSISKLTKGKIDVREIIHDVLYDGNIMIYSNLDKSRECKELENLFNEPVIKQVIDKGVPIFYLLTELKKGVSRCSFNNNFNIVVCVKPNVFEESRTVLSKYRKKSFFEICRDLENQKSNQTGHKYGFKI